MLLYFMSIWNILQEYGIFNGAFVIFVVIWYVFLSFGILYQEKSGNPDPHPHPPEGSF
jgi:hypothetical protein